MRMRIHTKTKYFFDSKDSQIYMLSMELAWGGTKNMKAMKSQAKQRDKRSLNIFHERNNPGTDENKPPEKKGQQLKEQMIQKGERKRTEKSSYSFSSWEAALRVAILIDNIQPKIVPYTDRFTNRLIYKIFSKGCNKVCQSYAESIPKGTMPADSKSGLSWWLRKQSKTLALRKLHPVRQCQLHLTIQSLKSSNAISLLSGLLNGSINFWTQSALTQRTTPESTSATWTRDGSLEWVAALSMTITSPNHQAELSESTSSGWSQTNTTSPGLTSTNRGIDRLPLIMPWLTLIAASDSNTFVLNTEHATGNERLRLTFLVLSVGRRHSRKNSAKPNDLATAELASDVYAAHELDQLREWWLMDWKRWLRRTQCK